MEKLCTMRVARRRFKAERKAGTDHGLSFREWARKTYAPLATTDKLFRIIRGAER